MDYTSSNGTNYFSIADLNKFIDIVD